jgi:glutaredoxin-like protein NrdH
MLDKNNIKYDSVDLSSDREAYDMVTKMGYQSAPVIFAGKDHWSGFRIDKIHSLVANKTQQ